MRTVSARRILEGVWALFAGSAIENLGVEDFTRLLPMLNKRLKQAWEFYFWPDLMVIEQRPFRLEWDGTKTYISGDEVYYTPADKYYQSLTAGNLNHAPATGSPLAENSAWWAESASSYSASDWVSGVAYLVGQRVLYQGTYYQCISGHTASDVVTPADVTKWGRLAAFDRYVGYEQAGQTALGTIVNVSRSDPRIKRNAVDLEFWLSDKGVQVPFGPTRPWLEYRQRTPDVFGRVWDATATYASGDQVYFRSEADTVNYPGNFYNCVTATGAGDSPASAAAKWAVVSILERFERFVVQGVYQDSLTADGQNDKGAEEEARALDLLSDQMLQLINQSGLQRRPQVLTR